MNPDRSDPERGQLCVQGQQRGSDQERSARSRVLQIRCPCCQQCGGWGLHGGPVAEPSPSRELCGDHLG